MKTISSLVALTALFLCIHHVHADDSRKISCDRIADGGAGIANDLSCKDLSGEAKEKCEERKLNKRASSEQAS